MHVVLLHKKCFVRGNERDKSIWVKQREDTGGGMVTGKEEVEWMVGLMWVLITGELTDTT